MTERLFPTLERTDLIVQTYDANLARTLMDTDATPKPGTSVEFDEDVTVTFEGSFVRRGEPAPDGLLFAIDAEADHGTEGITSWLRQNLNGESLVNVETRRGLVNLDEDSLQEALEEDLVMGSEE